MERYSRRKYFSKMKFWKLFGNQIRIFDENKQNILFFVKQKAFKLKENIMIYSDESMSEILIEINARSILDFGATYDIVDVQNGQKYGAVRRKMLKSFLRDSWEILDVHDLVIGKIEEDSMFRALLRRFFSNLIPQGFTIMIGESVVAYFKQTFNPFVPQLMLDFTPDVSGLLPRQTGISIAVLLQVIEGRQQ